MQKYNFETKPYITEIRLLEKNPRYSNLNINFNNDIGLKDYKYDELKIIKKLISYEESLDELRALIVSIAESFRPFEDPIFCILGKDNNYYVIEGNRRIMTLKLLVQYYHYFFNKNDNINVAVEENLLFEDLIINNNQAKSFFDEDIRDKLNLKVEQNYKIILNTIKKFIRNNQRIENFLYVKIDKTISNEEIWKIINGRQSAEKTGKRIFGRLHQFYMILDKYNEIYSNLNDVNKTIFELSTFFGKEITKSILYSSIWVINIVEIYNKKFPNKKINRFMFAPSAIELARNTVKYKDMLSNKDQGLSKFIKLKFDLTKKDNFEKLLYDREIMNEQKFKEMAIFLVEAFGKGTLTTRGMENKTKEEFNIKYIFQDKFKTLSYQVNEILKKDENDWTSLEKSLIDYKKNTENMKGTIYKSFISNKIENIENPFKKVLCHIWTYDISKYINLSEYRENEIPFLSYSVSIRTTLDYLILLALDVSDEFLNLIKNFYKNIQFNTFEGKKIISSESEEKFNKMKTKKIEMFNRETINKIKNEYNNKDTPEEIRKIIRDNNHMLVNDIVNSIMASDKVRNVLTEYEIDEIKYSLDPLFTFYKVNNESKNFYLREDWNILNTVIHNTHIIFDNDQKVKIINTLNRQGKFIFDLLKKIKIL